MDETNIGYFSDLEFRTYGRVRNHGTCVDGKRFAGYYGIQYTHEGRLEYAIDGEPPKIYDAPCVFFSMPGHLFHYGAPAGETREHNYLCFSGPRVRRYLAGSLLDATGGVVAVTHPERFQGTMLEIERLLSVAAAGRAPARAVLLLDDLLLQLREQQPRCAIRVTPFCREQILKLMAAIRSSPEREWDFRRKAAELSISTVHFRRIFRETAGVPPARFLIDSRLDRAARILRETVLGVGETARQCGFDDKYYFSRLFHRHCGTTPLAYRKEFGMLPPAPPDAERPGKRSEGPSDRS